MRIYKGDPGIQHLEIAANRKKLKEIDLEAGEARVVDIAAAMRDGDKTVTLTARGRRSSS